MISPHRAIPDDHRMGERRSIERFRPLWWSRVGGVNLAATGIIGGFAMCVALLVAPGGLYIDDFRAQAYAAGRPIWPFIVESNATHLSPGPRTADWVQAHYFPLAHWPLVIYTVVLSLALGVVVWRFIRLHVPQAWAALLGLAVALFGASNLPTLAWGRQALTTMTALTLTLFALEGATRYLRGEGRRWLAVAVVGAPLALAFSERALVIPVVVLTLALTLGAARSPQGRGRALRLLVPMGIINLVFLAFYGSGDYDHADAAAPTLSGFVLTTARALFVNAVPQLLGGPVQWRAVGDTYSFASTPTWLVVVALTALVALAVFWFRRRGSGLTLTTAPTPWRLLLVAMSYALPIYVMLYIGRVSRGGIASVDDLRLYPDIAILLAIVVAAVLGVVFRPPRRSASVVVAGVCAAAFVTVSFATTWIDFAHRWHQSTSAAYVEALTHDLEANMGPVVPGPVPASIVPHWVQPDFSSADLVRLLAPTTQQVLIDAPATLVAASGHLAPAKLQTVATATNARRDFCGNSLPGGVPSLEVSFDEPVPFYNGALLRFKVLVSDTTQVTIVVTGDDGARYEVTKYSNPSLQRGPHSFVVPAPPGVRLKSAILSRSRPESDVCVTSLAVVLPTVRR